MGGVYFATLFAFSPFWSLIGVRPLLFLPLLFLAQITQTSTPWLIVLAGLSWDTMAFWPVGISSVLYFVSSFLWPLWQRWVVSSYMIWGVFAIWAISVHGGAWLLLTLLYQYEFPLEVMVDIAFTICCFPVCAYLWPFGRSH